MTPCAQYNQTPERPIGVTILAVLHGFGIMVAIFFLFPKLAGMRSLNLNFPLVLLQAICGAATAYDAFMAVGLWQVQEWGRILSILRSCFVLFISLCNGASKAVTGSVLIQVLLSLGVIIYLIQPEVKQAFRRPKPASDATTKSVALGAALFSFVAAVVVLRAVYSSSPSSPPSGTTITFGDPTTGPLTKHLTVEEEKEYNQDPSGFMSKWVSIERQSRGKQ